MSLWLLKECYAHPLLIGALSDSPLIFVDVGAAVGVEDPWCDLISDRKLTKVVAFEPHPDNFQKIKREPNGDYHQIAIGEKDDSLPFYLDGTESSLTNRTGNCEHQMVSVRSLQSLRHDGTIPSLDVIKTDAECHDFEAMMSAGHFLADETLAIQCEFGFDTVGEPAFREYDAVLSPKGFKLFGLSTQRGALGEIMGGNFLYVRDIFSLLDDVADPQHLRVKALKLFAISISLSNLNYAYVIARALGEQGILSPDESSELVRLSTSGRYMPDAYQSSPLRNRIAAALGNLAHLVVGQDWRAVSSLEANRLHNYSLLVRKGRADTHLYEYYYNEVKQSHTHSKSAL
ncbi:FkbM family methyltransferase [Tardiphaga alba]|nr:FkbM family methyltransferase [Tardiphaga alba]